MNKVLSIKITGCLLLVLMILGVCGCTETLQNDDTISEIRVSVELADDQVRDYTFLRIYYGYCRNGKWRDQPSEKYELKSIFAPKQTTGYNAAGRSHLVKIGPYLLICIANISYDQDPETTIVCEITDTLGSTVEEPFAEFSTASLANTSDQQYGYLKKEGLKDTYVEYLFRHYYFLTLDYAALPNDYVLECKYTSSKETVIETLTYDDIVQLIEK